MTDFTNILDPDFPAINREAVRPSVSQVATLERTRTTDTDGNEQGTFTANTRPSVAEVENLIDLAMEMVLTDLPDFLPEPYYNRVQQAITLKTAVLIETSYFREQLKTGSAAAGYDTMYDKLIASIEMVAGGSGQGQRVDSIMMRSSMAEYQPDYSPPPPRVIIKTPIPFSGDPTSEGQF